MSAEAGETLTGVFNVLKPPGMTSSDVVVFLRRALKLKKVGHGGTLDPDAAGVLPVFAGKATRLLEFALEGRKEYLAEISLGSRTATGDDSGAVLATAAVPQLSREILLKTMGSFLGQRQQKPPMYSAVKIGGKKLYQLARSNKTVERQARTIMIYSMDLLHFTPTSFTIAVACSKGTYIRVLAEEMAQALGTYGTLSFLLRTQVGVYRIEEAATLQEIVAEPAKYLQSPLSAVGHLPKLNLTSQQAVCLTRGVATTIRALPKGRYVLLSPQNEFLGLAVSSGDSLLKAEKIFVHYNPIAE